MSSKAKKSRNVSFSMTWMNPVTLPNTPAQAQPQAHPVAAAPPTTTGNPKNKFQWKAPTRNWHNGVPPGMQAPPVMAAPHKLPEKRCAAPDLASSQPPPRCEKHARSCMGQSFDIDDWLCGAAALCTQRPGAPRPAPLQPSSPALDNDTLDELMMAEEDEETGGLWKLVTDLFQMPAGWGEEGLQQRDPRRPTTTAPLKSTLPTPPPTVMPYPPQQQLPATLGQPGPVLPPMQQPSLHPAASNGGHFSPVPSQPKPRDLVFTIGAPPTSPPEDRDAFLDRVLTGIEAGDLASHETGSGHSTASVGNDHGRPLARVESIDGTIHMDTMEVKAATCARGGSPHA